MKLRVMTIDRSSISGVNTIDERRNSCSGVDHRIIFLYEKKKKKTEL